MAEESPPLKLHPRTEKLLLCVRQVCIMLLGALEDYLDLPRTKQPKTKK